MLGGIANAATQAVNILGQALTVPIYLTYWGSQLYGEWMILTAAVAYLWLLDFGMQTYVVNRLNQAYARGDMDGFHEVLHSGVLFVAGICGVALAVLLPLATVMPLNRWFQLQITDPHTAMAVVMIMVVQTVSSVPAGLVNGIYRSIGEFPRGTMIYNGYRAALLGGGAIVVALGGGLRALALQQMLTLIAISVVFVVYDLRRRHPEIEIGWRRGNVRLALSFLGPSWLFFMIQMSGALTQQGSTLLAGAFAGAASVALFTTFRTLGNMLRQATTLIYQSAWPELTAMEARRDYDTLRSLHVLMAKAIMVVTATAGVILHFVGAEVIAVWTRGKVEFDGGLMNAFLLLAIGQGWWMASSGILGATNHHRTLAVASIAASTLGLAGGAFLAPRFGAAGIVYGMWIVDLAICGFVIPKAACAMAGQRTSTFAWDVLVRGIPVIGVVYLVSWTMWRVLPESANWRLSVLPCAALLAALPLWLGFWLNSAERSQLARQLARGRFARLASRLA